MRKRTWTLVIALVALAVAATTWLGRPTAEAQSALDTGFEAFVDKYLREVRGVGGNLPSDMTAASFARRLDTERALLKELSTLDASKLTIEQRTEYRLLKGTLESDVRERAEVQRWKQDPRAYVETNPHHVQARRPITAPPTTAARRSTNDMRTLQARIANGKINLTQFMPELAALRQRAHRRHASCTSRTAIPDVHPRLSPAVAQRH